MENTRIIPKNLWRIGDIVGYSSQNPQFRAVCTQDDDTVIAWRSRSGVGTGNGLFVVDANNKYIDFDEGGAELTATLTEGIYNGTTAAVEAKTRMDAAGGTYTVSYSETTGKLTISRTGNFTLRWNTGTHAANSAAGLFGYSAAADDTGADTYTSDYARFNTYEYLDLDNGSALEYDFISLRGHALSSAAVITLYGADDAAFTTNLVSDVIAYNETNISAFLAAARTKRYVRLKIVDPANAAGYISIAAIVLGKYRDLGCIFNQGYGDGYVNDSEVEEAPSGNRFLTVEKTSLQELDLTWTHLTDTTKAYVDEAVRECLGSVYALAICLDYTAPNDNTYWVYMAEIGQPVNTGVGSSGTALWTWSAKFREQA